MAQRPRCGLLSRNPARVKAWAGLVALLQLNPGGPARAADMPPPLATQLAGKTLSAVAYVPRSSGASGGLQRIVLQAYLTADGRALLRQWIGSRNSYTALVQTHWSLSENRLCIDLPTGQLCAKVHIWGPRIAGVGTQPYAMLDGDLQPGNAIAKAR
jgi:hypothetical protein